MGEIKRCEHYAICEQFKEPCDATTLAQVSLTPLSNAQMETVLAQWKVACNRAWEIVKERDQETKRLKARIRRLETVATFEQRQKKLQEFYDNWVRPIKHLMPLGIELDEDVLIQYGIIM